MPSYFYHLKFELYPYSYEVEDLDEPNESKGQPPAEHKKRGKGIATDSSRNYASAVYGKGNKQENTIYKSRLRQEGGEGQKKQKQSKQSARDSKREVWVPTEGRDIFDTGNWPSHKVFEEAQTLRGQAARGSGEEGLPGAKALSERQAREKAAGKVALKGRGLGGSSADREEIAISKAPTSTRGHTRLEAAKKDYRFGRVRIQGVDVNMELGPGHQRGESSSAIPSTAPSTAGPIVKTGTVEGGRVTKARYEDAPPTNIKNTEVGWGIVHLYRDGEEASVLGRQGDIYTADQIGEGGEEECTTLCVPAVPSYLTPSDFLGFVGQKARENVSHFRMVVTGKTSKYLVLMKFRDAGKAREWKKEWEGKRFYFHEPETCHIAYIKTITFQTPSASSRSNNSYPELSHDPFTPSASSASLNPLGVAPNLIELPTCPVCLERMDDTETGLLTILCQHLFHCECLQKWRGTGCPVCRHTNPSLALPSFSSSPYPQDPQNPPFGSGEASLCSICDCADDLWICLICGNVGCGRYKGGHAKDHWKESAHNYALEIETQHVWDYMDDVWVHRLIRGKGDEKIIDLHSRPAREESENRERRGDMVPREKLDAIGMDYTHLLTNQLESQRVYFEGLVQKAVAKAEGASSSAAAASSKAEDALARLSELELENKKLRSETIAQLEKDLEREKRKAGRSSELARTFGQKLQEEKKVSEGLLERVAFVNKSLMSLSTEMTQLREEKAELEESNRDLLFSITAGQKLKDMEEEAAANGQGGILEKGETDGASIKVGAVKGKGRKK